MLTSIQQCDDAGAAAAGDTAHTGRENARAAIAAESFARFMWQDCYVRMPYNRRTAPACPTRQRRTRVEHMFP